MFDPNSPWHRISNIVVGLVFIGLGLLSLSKSGHILMLMLTLCLFMVGAVILAFPVAEMVVEWFSRFFSEFFFSDHRLRGPQPIYSIPEARRCKGDLQGAWDALEKIAEEFPQEVKAYTDMIDIAMIDCSDPELAEKVLERGLHALKKKKDQEALQLAHSLILSRLHSRKEKAAALQSLGGS